jgi:hypothetical protein
MIYLLLPWVICLAIIITLMAIALGVNFNEQKDAIGFLILFSCIEIVLFLLLFIIKFYKGKRYIFSKESIEVYKKDKLINKVSIVDIKSIEYFRRRLLWTILSFFGGCMYFNCTLAIELNDGKKLYFGYFSKKDVQRLKDELYGDLITIS